MSEVFEGYERQYCELSANLSKKCTASGALNGEKKKQKLSEIKAGLEDAEALIRKMDLEARSLQPNVKAVLLAKLREYKSDLNNLKSEVKRIASGNLNPAARDELLESGLADALTASADQRSRLMTTTERLNQSSDRIKDSRRTMLETEELGVSILQDLHSQRQSLLHANNTVSLYGLCSIILYTLFLALVLSYWICCFFPSLFRNRLIMMLVSSQKGISMLPCRKQALLFSFSPF
ncbi:hypothetical protein J1N35_040228 [Gossypium stocksii]|uniref:Vesicle transport v-SNARE N-terminal domain-containing protein n=1 Tax=Gossypium stocksii TaxID=47602 RepID=A0A9D3ZHI3_9ROSI|nr:hypothetical protein J1N35_040228 [Gossypium stocksii]